MQWAKSWFVSAKPEPEPDETLTTEQMIKSLKMKRKQKMHESKALETEAKQLFKSGDKAKASQILKRRNVIETRLRQINGQLSNMEQQNTTLESAMMANDIASTMKNGVSQTQQIMTKIDVSDIDEIVDNMEDLTVQSFELTESLSRPAVGSAYMDYNVDDKIAAQLAEWEDEDQLEFPSVPTGEHVEVGNKPAIRTL